MHEKLRDATRIIANSQPLSKAKYFLKTFVGKEMSLTFAIPKSSLEEFICLGVVHKSE